MIAQLSGILFCKNQDAIVIDVNGVGYEVFVSKTTGELLPDSGLQITLHVYTHVTEGAVTLFGFLDETEKKIFKKLIRVSGVGPRIAMQILSGMTSHDLVNALIAEDLVRLTSINGVGKKTAERLIVELKDKLAGFSSGVMPLPLAAGKGVDSRGQTYREVLSALVNLGYHRLVAEKVLTQISIGANATVEDVLRRSLSSLSQGMNS